ncbi:hypothetical protein KY304_01180 [Candidatus Woesearchaeota archaeon]|nr:hypothetical protein [Candidatus Woesearchaeota archaeon]
MVLKDILKTKVPEDIQATPEFRILLAIIKRKKIKGPAGLQTHVKSEIKLCREWIKKNQKQSKQGTMQRHLKKYTNKLDFYELINKKILGFL